MANNFTPGDLVKDVEENPEETNVVILAKDIPVKEWEIEDDHTVYDMYDCEEDEHAIIIVKKEFLDEGLEEWEDEDPFQLFDEVCDNSIPFDAVPESRIKMVSK